MCHSSWRERLKKCVSPVSRGQAQRLRVHVRERQNLARAPVLHHARDKAALVEAHLVEIRLGAHGSHAASVGSRAALLDPQPVQHALVAAPVPADPHPKLEVDMEAQLALDRLGGPRFRSP